MADNNSIKLQEGVQVSQAEIKSEGQINRTTAAATALLALALYAGSPAPAKAETPTDNKAVVTFVVNAEYEGIIATAKKEGKNPVEVAMIMKQDGKYTFAQFRAFSKYYGDKLKTEEAQIDKKLVAQKTEEAQLDQKLVTQKTEEAQLDQKLVTQGRSLIAVFEGLLREGKFTAKEEAIINRMYISNATPVVIKQELLAKFEKYIGKGITIAQNTAN